MFQKFEVLSTPARARAHVEKLRATFDDLGIDALAVPRSDEYLGEYVPACNERLAWLTSFTGSAGQALILRKQAHVFTDGRYAAQVRAQTDPQLFSPVDMVATPLADFLRAEAPKGLRLGIDPWTWTSAEVERIEAALADTDGKLVLLAQNPVDSIWEDRPEPPVGAVSIQPLEYAGVMASEKIAAMQQKIADDGADAVVLTDPSSLAWTFNIRGEDLPSTPHPLARAVIPANGRPQVFIDKRKTGRETEAYLTQLCDIRSPEEFGAELDRLGAQHASVMVDPAIAPHAVAVALAAGGASVINATDPARIPRAVKNPAELKASAQIHRQDGAAMVRFLAWFDVQKPGSLDEISVTTKLEEIRTATGQNMQMPLKALSFDSISGAGPNGAIIHYRVNRQTNRPVKAGEMFLIDSGGQYVAGTTDITRTIAVGEVPQEQRRYFTLVLKGMIAISRLRFPKGTRGVDIDAFARHALWQAGADYAHGTGHGVGSYLSVHEGPQTISRRGMQELLPGMILSNEPGYYRDGAFGVRIENLVHVHEPRVISGGDTEMLGFVTLTLCPIDRRLVVRELLDDGEIAWLDAYHARVLEEIGPLISEPDVEAWLRAAAAPL